MFPAQPQAPCVTLKVPAQQKTGHIGGGDRNPSRALWSSEDYQARGSYGNELTAGQEENN